MSSPSTTENNKVRTLVNKSIAPLIREQLSRWYRELKEEFTQGMVLPTKAKEEAQAAVRLHASLPARLSGRPKPAPNHGTAGPPCLVLRR